MTVKLFEIRDKGTFIPALAVRCEPDLIPRDGLFVGRHEEDVAERYLLRRAGYNAPWDLVILTRLECGGGGSNATYDPYSWGGCRTMQTAHQFIERNWHKLQSGDVICVETILGERPEPKTSERMECPL